MQKLLTWTSKAMLCAGANEFERSNVTKTFEFLAPAITEDSAGSFFGTATIEEPAVVLSRYRTDPDRPHQMLVNPRVLRGKLPGVFLASGCFLFSFTYLFCSTLLTCWRG